MLLAWGDLFYPINLRAATLSPVVIGMLSLSLPTSVGGNTTIYSHLNSILYQSLRPVSATFFFVSDLEEASSIVFWKTAPSLSILHANALCLANTVAIEPNA